MASTDEVTARPLRDDRFLLGILAGIGMLLILALVAVVLLRGPARELPAATPGGTVQRFLRAMEGQEYDRAYDYLSDTMTSKPSREEFTRYNAERMAYDQMGVRLRIERESISGDFATVAVEVTRHSTNGPIFGGSEWTSTETFALRREGGDWRITSLPYEYWSPKWIGEQGARVG
jgi:hypothetical protein